MNLKSLSEIICTPGTASENRPLRIMTYLEGKTIWSGEAMDLQYAFAHSEGIDPRWEVVEIRVDEYDHVCSKDTPSWNKGKIIYVI